MSEHVRLQALAGGRDECGHFAVGVVVVPTPNGPDGDAEPTDGDDFQGQTDPVPLRSCREKLLERSS